MKRAFTLKPLETKDGVVPVVVSEDDIYFGNHYIIFASGINGFGRGWFMYQHQDRTFDKLNMIVASETRRKVEVLPELIPDTIIEAFKAGKLKEDDQVIVYLKFVRKDNNHHVGFKHELINGKAKIEPVTDI